MEIWRVLRAAAAVWMSVQACAHAEPPRIVRGAPMAGSQLGIEGQHFGESCPTCEVIGDYGGLRYALPVLHWSDNRIVVRLPDLNAGTDVNVRVHAASGVSASVSATVRRQWQPELPPSSTVAGSRPDLQMFSVSSSQKVGNRGEESFNVSQSGPSCGQTAWVFDHAKLVVGRARFGEAAIVSAPAPGCMACAPLKVRWYHEPTGFLDFQVHVMRRRVEGVCAALRR